MCILLVDDNPEVRATCRMMLEMAGFEVAEAASGAEGLRVFRNRRVALVLCDLYMPDQDGFDLLRELQRELPGVKVIVMSGGGCGGKFDLLPVARRLGAVEVLHKPFKPSVALAAINRALVSA